MTSSQRLCIFSIAHLTVFVDPIWIPLKGILKNASPLPKSSAAADVDLDRTVILPLFVPLLGLDLVAASNAAYTIASKPVRIVLFKFLAFAHRPCLNNIF